MKITLILFFTAFLLSMSPPRKPRVSKDIIGTWVLLYYIKPELGSDGIFSFHGEFTYAKMKMPDNKYTGYEFRKKGEVIVNWNPFPFCGTFPPSYDSARGEWKQVSDSTVQITYEKYNQKITENHRLFWNGRDELELEQLDSI